MAEGKDGSVIYQHPQSRVFSKMAALVRLKAPLPALPSDPVPVLDRKLEQEDERLKKDNRRWRAVICLTVTICLIIFCLVLAQVISSVSSTAGRLPNIDVSEKAASPSGPRHEPLVAANPADRAAPGSNWQATVHGGPEKQAVLTTSQAGQIADLEIKVAEEENAESPVAKEAQEEQEAEETREVHIGLPEEPAQSLSGIPEARSGYVAYIPVPLGGEERNTPAPTTSTTTTPRPPQPPSVVRHRPFFVPVMFQEQRAPPSFRRPPPPFQRPPAPMMTPPRPPGHQPHRLPTRLAANQRPPFQGHPLPSLPPANQQHPFQGHPLPSLPPANQRHPFQGHPLPSLPPANQRHPFQGHPPPSLPPANQRPPFQGHPPTGSPLTNHGRPLQGHTSRPLHPQLSAFLGRPASLPPSFNLQQDSNVQQNARPIGPLPLDDEQPFSSRVGSILRDMRQLMNTVRPLMMAERPLPSNVSLSRLLGPRGPFGPPRSVPRRPLAPQTRAFPPRPPPAGLRPGPFRPPISVAPPLRATNHRVFAPRPANQRPFRPRPGAVHPTNQRVFGQQRNLVQSQRQAPHGVGGDPSRRFPAQVSLVGNPQYSYPSTATGIQDILRYIQGGRRPPQNGHGAYNGLSRQQGAFNPNTQGAFNPNTQAAFNPNTQGAFNPNTQGAFNPNTRYSSSEISSHSFGNNGGFSSNDGGLRSGADRDDGQGYSGPIYPPGYDGQRFSLGSASQPFRLMLDVYPMDNSDRYEYWLPTERLLFL